MYYLNVYLILLSILVANQSFQTPVPMPVNSVMTLTLIMKKQAWGWGISAILDSENPESLLTCWNRLGPKQAGLKQAFA